MSQHKYYTMSRSTHSKPQSLSSITRCQFLYSRICMITRGFQLQYFLTKFIVWYFEFILLHMAIYLTNWSLAYVQLILQLCFQTFWNWYLEHVLVFVKCQWTILRFWDHNELTQLVTPYDIIGSRSPLSSVNHRAITLTKVVLFSMLTDCHRTKFIDIFILIQIFIDENTFQMSSTMCFSLLIDLDTLIMISPKIDAPYLWIRPLGLVPLNSAYRLL